jgi:hypothetical protein
VFFCFGHRIRESHHAIAATHDGAAVPSGVIGQINLFVPRLPLHSQDIGDAHNDRVCRESFHGFSAFGFQGAVRLNDKRSGPAFTQSVATSALVQGFDGDPVVAKNLSNGRQNTGLIFDHKADVQPALNVV